MKDPKKSFSPSEAELEILQVLWEIEPATVRQVHERLQSKRKVGYTTTLKQMQRMTEAPKNMLLKLDESTPHQFKAIVRESEVQKTMFKRLLDTAFKGSAMQLVMHALGEAKTDPEEIAQLEAWLQKQKDHE
ncbi:MAG: BlaI/MecI/CopY family transcriptional regulator [Bacteroidota bacterium]